MRITRWAAVTAAGEVLETYQEEPDDAPEGATILPQEWEGTVVLEDVRTSDDRGVRGGALSWRELPLPLMWLKEDSHGGMPTSTSVLVGSIERLARDGGPINGGGSFDLEGEDGREAARLVGEELLRWVSADLSVQEYELEFEGDCGLGDQEEADDLEDVILDESCHIIEWVLEGQIMGATLVAFPAFEDAVVRAVVASGGRAALERFGSWPAGALVAATPPTAPPAAWFGDPELAEATPVTVTDEGRVYGHAAGPDCHLGFMDRCMTVDTATSRDFSRFNDGKLTTREGTDVWVGQITLAGGHAPQGLDAHAATRHYDDTEAAVADVTVGWDDRNGLPYFAGALRPGATPEQVRTLMASGVSGDWRPIQGERRLVALLSVNVPGWGIPRSSVLVASGEIGTMILAPVCAAGSEPSTFGADPAIEARVAALEARALRERVGPARERTRERLRAGVHP